MSITQQDIQKLAELAKLDLNTKLDSTTNNTNFKEQLIFDLNNILKLVDELKNVDTSNIAPMVHADEYAKQRLREDLITEPNVRDDMQKIAPANSIEAGLYLVPQVIETN